MLTGVWIWGSEPAGSRPDGSIEREVGLDNEFSAPNLKLGGVYVWGLWAFLLIQNARLALDMVDRRYPSFPICARGCVPTVPHANGCVAGAATNVDACWARVRN